MTSGKSAWTGAPNDNKPTTNIMPTNSRRKRRITGAGICQRALNSKNQSRTWVPSNDGRTKAWMPARKTLEPWRQPPVLWAAQEMRSPTACSQAGKATKAL